MNLDLTQGTKIIKTTRCLLRPLSLGDKRDIFDNINHNQEVLKYFLTAYYEHYDDFTLDSLFTRIASGLLCWAIVVDNTTIGFIIEQTHDEKARSIELGYAIGQPYWGKGYVPEALQAIQNYLYQECCFHKISYSAIVDNTASIRVMEKLGCTKEGICIDEIYYHDKFQDVVYYSKINPNEKKGGSL